MKRNFNEDSRWIEYERYVQSQGFKIIKIVGDGNCLFRAISHQLRGSQKHHQFYRLLAINYIQENKEKFNNFLNDDDEFGGRLDLYIQKMSQDGEWGGHFEMFALSEALKIRICLFQETLNFITIGSFQENQSQTIYLAYNRSRRHYNSAIRNSLTPTQTLKKGLSGK